MSIKITDTEMTSDQTRHAARGADDGWVVTWLPGRVLKHSQAVTAMTIAEIVRERADILADPQSKLWWHVDGWAGELGLSGPHAVATASLSPEEHGAEGGRPGAVPELPRTVTRGDAVKFYAAGRTAAGLRAHAADPETVAMLAAASAEAEDVVRAVMLALADGIDQINGDAR